MSEDLASRLEKLTPKQRELLLRKLGNKQKPAAKKPTLSPQSRDGDRVPASITQIQLWVSDTIGNSTPQFNIPMGLRLVGPLNASALIASVQQVIARHESLRTTFHNQDGWLYQKIHDAYKLKVPVIDLCDQPIGKREAEAHRIMAADAQRPFSTNTLPLMRATLIRLVEQEHILYVTQHHIISDGWSIGVFYDDLLSTYSHLCTGEQAITALPALPVQYGDYALWQQSPEFAAIQQKQLSYWLQKLAGELPVLELPTDFPRPNINTHRGKVQTCLIPKTLVNQMQAIAQQVEATLSMTLLAVYKLLLHRYTGLTDVLVGIGIANRQHQELEKLIGLFVNTIVIRTDISNDPTFLQMLQQVRHTNLEAYENQDLSYARLVEELHPERNSSQSPVYQTYFGMQNYPYATLRAAEIQATPLPDGYVHTDTSKMDLSLLIYYEGENLRCVFEYSTDLFRDDTITRLMGHWQTLIADVAGNPTRKLSAYHMLPAAEQTTILHEWNQTQAPITQERTLPQQFAQQVAHTPDAIALVDTDQTLTYRQLDERATQLAQHLTRLGIGPEVLVGICMERKPEMIVGLLGVLKAGGGYVPIDPAYPPDRIAFMLTDAQVRVVLTQKALLASDTFKTISHDTQFICLDTDWPIIIKEAQEMPLKAPLPDNVAYIIYTSGSTGQPKGVTISHQNAAAMLSWAAEVFSTEERQAVLAATSISFDLSVYELFLPLSHGGTIVLAENALHLRTLPQRDTVTLINTVPSAMIELVRNRAIPDSVHTINLAGEPLKQALVQEIYAQSQVQKVYNLYGPSEDTTYSTFALIEAEETGEPSIGKPISNTSAYILDRHMAPVPIGVIGELYLGGMGLSRGYLRRPGLTAERYVPHPFSDSPGQRLYKTGDLVRYGADGSMEFLGRIDHQIKLRGYRIELGEIETQLVKHPDIQEAVVIVYQAGSNDQRLVAYVTTTQEQAANLTTAVLRDYLYNTLPKYMIPSAFIPLAKLPLTPNGKINRRALPSPTQTVNTESITAPRTPIEDILAAIWCYTLSIPKVDIHADFFDLGGHSLLATKVLAQIEKQLQTPVPLGQFFANPTIAHLAIYIEQERRSAQKLRIPPIQPMAHSVTVPLSSAQKRMWFLYQLAPQAATYNVPTVLRLEGELHIEALAQALDEIVVRHAILRTTYEVRQGQPVSIIHPPTSHAIPVRDLRHLSGADQEQATRQAVVQFISQPIDLINGPLLRRQLIKTGETTHILGLVTHHIAMDGWSIPIFAQEMTTLYKAYLENQPISLPVVPIQYADYAVWQQNWIHSESFQQQLDYWRERLTDAHEPLRLPADHPLPKDAALIAQGAVYSWYMETSLSEQARQFARSEGCTPFILLLTAFQLLLYRYSGQQKIHVGIPIANRNHSEIAELIGFFINTLVISADFNNVKTFRDLLAQVRQETLGAFDRQDMPFDELVKAFSQGQRHTDRQPFFRVMFNFQRGDNVPATLEMPGLAFSFVEADTQTAKFDLLLEGAETKETFGFNFSYRRALFDRETIIKIVSHLEHLLHQVIANPDQAIASYSLWSDDVLQAWKETAVLLQQHPAIDHARVCAWQDMPASRGLTAYLVLQNEAITPSAADMRKYLITQGSRVIPTNFVFVAQLTDTLPIPPDMDDSQPQQTQMKAQVQSAQAQLEEKKAALSDKKRALLEKMLTRSAKDKQTWQSSIPPRPQDKPVPLSYAQERLWFLHQLSPSAAYNMPFRFDLPAALDVDALRKSLAMIIERHEVLRTAFHMAGEQPIQVIQPPSAYILPQVDLSALAEGEQEAAWMRLSTEDAQRPFQFDQPPLFRAQLVHLTPIHYRLILTLHHIVFDGWSWGIFMRELTELYTAFSHNRPNPLSPLPIQYADFAYWQRQAKQQQKFDKQIDYWKQQLADAPASLELPTDFPRPSVPTYQGASYELTLPPELGVQIKQLVQTAEITPFVLYLTTFTLLLYRYTGQEDIVIGTPVANRLMREIEPLIGFFVNTVALRLRFNLGMTVQELLQHAQHVMLDAQSNQDVPFESVVQAVRPNRELSRQPLFQVMILTQEDGEANANEAFPATPFIEDSHTAKFDLLVSFAPSGSSVFLEYSTDLFAADTIARMAQHIQTLLTELVRYPTQTIATIPILSVQEHEQILYRWNDTVVSVPLDQGVHHLFAAQAQRTPQAIAVSFGETAWTYRELDERANQLAHFLCAQGVPIDGRVGVCMRRSLDMAVSVLGILKAGAAYVPLDPAYPVERLAFMIENAEMAVLLTQTGLTVPPHPRCVYLDQTWEHIRQYPTAPLARQVYGHNLLYIIYTSGSTGQPKGVAMPHTPLVNLIHWQQTHTEMNEPTRTLQFSSFSFDVSCQELFTTWANGGTLVLVDETTHQDAHQLVHFLDEQHIQRLYLPFVALQQIAEVAATIDVYPHALTHIVTAGEQLQSTRHIVNFFQHLPHCTLHNQYGPAECHVVTAHTLNGSPETWPARPPIGRPIANTHIHILDEALAPVPIGVAGMLYIGGVHVSRGYSARPGLTAGRFVPNPFYQQDTEREKTHSTSPQPFSSRLYRTGDLARYLPDGSIQFLGRRDFQVKIRGYRIELGELETLLGQHPQVLRAVVTAPLVPQGDAPAERRLVAYIVPINPEQNGLEETLRQYLQATTPQYMVPAFFIFLDALPKTASGKIDRRHLPAPGDKSDGDFVAPRDPVEMKLAELWQDILGVTAVSIHDNFFSLGGHSLLAVRLVSRMHHIFAQSIPVAALFQNSTIAQLAALLRSNIDLSSLSPLVKIRAQGTRSPLFLVHPGGGNVLPYVELAQYLDEEQPVYGFQSVGLTAPDRIQTTIHDMAATYLSALQDVQPHGPYLLGGWSMGGTVALEMAQQLTNQGETVTQVILIDTEAPLTTAAMETFDTLTFQVSFARDMGITPEELTKLNLADLNETDRLTAVIHHAQKTGKLPPDLPPATVTHLYHVFQTNYRAMVAYTPDNPYPGGVTLLKAAAEIRPDHDDMCNWQPWVRGTFTRYILPGNHFTLVRKPYLADLAAQMNTILSNELRD